MKIPLTFGPPHVAVERRADGAMIVKSPEPLAPYPRSMTDWLDHWAPRRARPRVPRRAVGRRLATGDLRGGARHRPPHRAGDPRSRPEPRAADRDPVGQQRRPCADRPRRDDRGRALRARLAALFAGRQGLRQAQDHPRRPDPRPRLCQRRRALHARARGGRAEGRRGRRERQSAEGMARRPALRPSSPSPPGPRSTRPTPRSAPTPSPSFSSPRVRRDRRRA